MNDAPSVAFATDVDYETYCRYVSATKLDEALKAGANSIYSAYRSLSSFRDRINTEGAPASAAEFERYHLYLAEGCPFCHRVLSRALRSTKQTSTRRSRGASSCRSCGDDAGTPRICEAGMGHAFAHPLSAMERAVLCMACSRTKSPFASRAGTL